MFTKTLLFFFCFVGMFAVLFAAIPSEYFYAGSYESSSGVDKEVAEYLSLANVTVYDTGKQDNMTFDYTSLEDSPSPPNYLIAGTTDDFCEVWWASVVGVKGIQLRHAIRKTIPWLYYDYHQMDIYYANGSRIQELVFGESTIFKSTIMAGWDASSGSSSFYGQCPHALFSVAFTIHNATRDATIGDAWDSGEIDYYLSYERNWNSTSINAATLLGQLLTFQNPNLGIPGLLGIVLNYSIALPFWVIAAVAIIKLVQSVIPMIRGVEE